MYTLWWLFVYQESILAFRKRSECLQPLFFFILVVSLFALSMSHESVLLRAMGANVIWVTLILSHLLSADTLFRNDWSDGSLQQIILSPISPLEWVYAKVFSHWLLHSLPLLVVTPFLGCLLGFSIHDAGWLLLILLVSTPTLSVLSALGASLTVGLRHQGILLSLLTLPLLIPVLLLGMGSLVKVQEGLPILGELALLLAITLFVLLALPWVIGQIIQVNAREQ